MLIAVLSDIHANLEALDAVLGHAREAGVCATYVLGDIVGYGADPQGVLDRLGALENTCLIAGNHDLAAVGRFDSSWFNTAAEDAIRWTAKELDDRGRTALEALEPRDKTPERLLVHGSVVEPITEYVTRSDIAARSFDAEEFSLCFFGHTHMPTVFVRGRKDVRSRKDVEGAVLKDRAPVRLGPGRTMMNPGSVGQPRDGDPRASFLLFDDVERVATLQRVTYDIDTAQRKIRAAGLPDVLADRLALGR